MISGRFCSEVSLDADDAAGRIFDGCGSGQLRFRESYSDVGRILDRLNGLDEKFQPAGRFFFERLISGREPYELCITTRDCLPSLDDPELELARFLAFETTAFAVTGRNVKTIYFNDLLALPNDHEKVRQTGELRNIKRTRSDYDWLLPQLEDDKSFISRISAGINNLIALVDSDPALHFRGNEAELLDTPDGFPAAVILNSCGDSRSIAVVNLDDGETALSLSAEDAGFRGADRLYDNISGEWINTEGGKPELRLPAFGRLWLTLQPIAIPQEKLR